MKVYRFRYHIYRTHTYIYIYIYIVKKELYTTEKGKSFFNTS